MTFSNNAPRNFFCGLLPLFFNLNFNAQTKRSKSSVLVNHFNYDNLKNRLGYNFKVTRKSKNIRIKFIKI
ncbi:hypothetical protein GCM10023315_05400 [Algibacter aquimarinus]|uniref:Uncharacterized protein n=1 Tax=Algibacter aquimarinus TaxID=1136748 RepID=A0ABP9H2T0_9FLAO